MPHRIAFALIAGHRSQIGGGGGAMNVRLLLATLNRIAREHGLRSRPPDDLDPVGHGGPPRCPPHRDTLEDGGDQCAPFIERKLPGPP
jgi:hypothetical protein